MFLSAHLSTIIRLISILLIAISFPAQAEQNTIPQSDEQIKSLLIQQSIDSYPGNCPCPYYVDSAGRQCGQRSAWSRSGGYSPLCYPNDVTPELIENYKNGTTY